MKPPALPRTKFRVPPPAFLALVYAGIILLGGGLLMLPIAQVNPYAWHDALFVATSAVTVTGLSVIDVGQDTTLFGQVVIITLIHVGGIGLMSFAVIFLSALGFPMGITGSKFLREDLNYTSVHGLLDLARKILKIAIMIELTGALILATVFIPEDGFWPGLWSAVFHAISAFNNAGFSLYADNLIPWVGNLRVNFTIPALFILGGLGYTVIGDLVRRKRWRKFSLHTKITLSGTAGLVVVGFLAVLVLEWSNPETLGGLESWEDRVLASWFQGVTTRTAGFNTLEINHLWDATAVVMMGLMAVGGGAASTAGGIKVTTFVVLLLTTLAFFRQRSNIVAFRKTVPMEDVFKALAIATLSVFSILLGVFVLAATHHELDFMDLCFEVVSAFGTTGLTHGITATLDPVGQFVLMGEMFVGRVGPLTAGFFLATRQGPRVKYPQERIQLG